MYVDLLLLAVSLAVILGVYILHRRLVQENSFAPPSSLAGWKAFVDLMYVLAIAGLWVAIMLLVKDLL